MQTLCKTNAPLLIALDEELIDLNIQDKETLLTTTSQFILKPSFIREPALHSRITFVEKTQYTMVVTSALESIIGLNAIKVMDLFVK
jgi:hypothetical protein